MSPDELLQKVRVHLYPQPLFQGIDPGALDREALKGRYRFLPMGTRVIRPLQEVDEGYLVLTGCLAALFATRLGTERATELLGPGMMAGVEVYMPDGQNQAFQEVLALVDTEALVYSRAQLLAYVEQGGWTARITARQLACRLQRVSRSFSQQIGMPVPLRLGHALLRLQELLGQDVLPITQTMLASVVGSNREAVATALRQFRKEGWVRTGRGWVEVRDLAALERWLQQAA